jgi:hypothetical protein
MIIPKGKRIVGAYLDEWQAVAAQIGMETGIFVEVDSKWDYVGKEETQRLVFILDGHEFETLGDLKKAIEMIAFI